MSRITIKAKKGKRTQRVSPQIAEAHVEGKGAKWAIDERDERGAASYARHMKKVRGPEKKPPKKEGR